MTRELFQVNLRGIVEILSHHLYSSPRVYVREVLQNARDAVRARSLVEPGAPASIDLGVDDESGELVVRDTGIGLTGDEMRQLLATVGATSKRGDFDEARSDFLGQFGIGLLSCFLVADSIEVRSKSAKVPDARTMQWTGFADGTYTVTEADRDLDGPGTELRLRARDDDRQWVGPRRVHRLVRHYGEYLDVPVRITDRGDALLMSGQTPPWRLGDTDSIAYCDEKFGFTPIAVVPISVPVAGVEAVAYVIDEPRRSGDRPEDVVFSHGMLVSDENRQLVPSWASFARLAIEAGDLPVTASRETLQESPLLGDVRDEIGRQLRAGIDRLANRDHDAFRRFLAVHEQALCGMATTDDDVLDLVVRHVPFATSDGWSTLADLMARVPELYYSTHVYEFDSLASVVAHNGGVLVNAGYTHLPEIIERVAARSAPGSSTAPTDSAPAQGATKVAPLDLEALVDGLGRPDPDDRLLAHAVERATRETLNELDLDLDVDVRSFEPASTPALYLSRPSAEETPEPEGGDRWGELLGAFAKPREVVKPRLILNVRCAPVRAIAGSLDPVVRRDSIVALFVLGRLQSGARLRERDNELLSDALHTLVVAATSPTHS